MNDVPTFEELTRQIKYQFRLLGIPFHAPVSLIKFLSIFGVLLLAMVEEIAFFYSRIAPEHFLELTQLFPCTAIGILALLKILPFFIKREKIFKLTDCLEMLYNQIKTEPDKFKRVSKKVIFTKMLVKYCIILNLILISIYTSSSALFMVVNWALHKEVRFELPFPVIVPFPVDTWFNWAVVYFQLVLSGFSSVLFFTTVDCMYYILTTQVCVNFKVLSLELEHYKHEDGHLNEIVKKHQYILRLSDHLEDIFTGPNFYNILIGSMSICALGFNIMTGDWAQFPGCVLFLSSMLIQILMMSYYGEDLSRESQRISDATYLCKWYEMDQKTKNTVLVIRERAKRPQSLTAYKFSVISYASFTSIIKASWSYFTILKTVYEPSEEPPSAPY